MSLVKLSTNTSQQEVAGTTYDVPDNASISVDVSVGECAYSPSLCGQSSVRCSSSIISIASYTLFKSGTDAANSFQADASLSAKYMAVSGSVDATYSINKTFHNEYQYALFAFNQHLWLTQFEDFASSIQEALIKNRVTQLKPFDSNDNAVVDTYRSFFKTMGSHCITGASYGSRMQLVRDFLYTFSILMMITLLLYSECLGFE